MESVGLFSKEKGELDSFWLIVKLSLMLGIIKEE